MGSCDGFQVEGYLRKASSGKRQILLELQPTSNLWKELCSFCDDKGQTTTDAHSSSTKHSHKLEGVLAISDNKLTFTLKDCEISSESTPAEHVQQSKHTLPLMHQEISNTAEQPLAQLAGSLQYQVDGKVYELKTNVLKENLVKPVQLDCTNHFTSTVFSDKPSIPSKSIEFVIENEKFTTTNLTQPPLEVFAEPSSDKSSELEASLTLLQVIVAFNCKRHHNTLNKLFL